jgi:membrane protein DedA with SNARE-associated domain
LAELNDLPLWLVQSEYWTIFISDPLHIAMGLLVLTFLLEDAAIAAGAAFTAHGLIAFEFAFAGLAIGIIAGDYGLYLLGVAARRFKTVRNWLPEHSQGFGRSLGLQLLIARIVPGLRLATYPLTAILGVAPATFMKWILLWGMLWTGSLLFVISHLSASLAHAVSLPPFFLAILFVLGLALIVRQLARVRAS